MIDAYLSAVGVELSNFRGYTPGTVYIGGGTPSFLSVRQLKKLFGIIKKCFGANSGAEISFEANPESLNEEKLEILNENGVTRISLGFQSCNDEYLKYLGRLHTCEKARQVYCSAREAGFDNINIDLIFGLPGQTATEWKEDLIKVLNLRPDHISAYELTLDESSPLYKHRAYINQDASDRMYEESVEIFESSGYRRYEVSNFSRPGKECLHNINYWLNREYIGVGAAAWSYTNGIRCRNANDIYEYLENAGNNDFIKHEREKLSAEARRKERLFIGLRMREGVRYDETDKILFAGKLRKYEEKGMISWGKNKVSLSGKGLGLANQIFRELI